MPPDHSIAREKRWSWINSGLSASLVQRLLSIMPLIPAARSLPLTLLEDSGDWARNGSETNVIGIGTTATLGPTERQGQRSRRELSETVS
jgi:hypothetical protein